MNSSPLQKQEELLTSEIFIYDQGYILKIKLFQTNLVIELALNTRTIEHRDYCEGCPLHITLLHFQLCKIENSWRCVAGLMTDGILEYTNAYKDRD